MKKLTKMPYFQALTGQQQQLAKRALTDLFKDPDRWVTHSYQLDELLIDLSKHYWDNAVLQNLVNLAESCQLASWIEKLFAGKVVNVSEQKAAKHTVLRMPVPQNNIAAELAKIKHFSRKIRQSSQLTDIVHIGIGGSHLGAQLVVNAFKTKKTKQQIHFVNCLDGEQAAELIKILDPAKTLIIVVSKSFISRDTLCNALTLKEWLSEQLPDTQWQQRIIGVSANAEKMTEFGILPDQQFLFWEWVGGRYSIWSSVGLTIAIALGFDYFKELLDGAHLLDCHFKTAPYKKNLPVLMGLLTVWYNNFWHYPVHAVLPYSSRLTVLPNYLQQLEMESCGKQVTQDGQPVNYSTGQVILGDVGPDAQHTFFQLLHQGTQIIPVDFIVPVNTQHQLTHHNNWPAANALAQASAFMSGRLSQDPHKCYPGNRPSTMLIFPDLTPKILGMLLALYEHKVFVQSVIWGINPFDQWGVELGKTIAEEIYNDLAQHALPYNKYDDSTQCLLHFIKKNKKG